MNRGIFPPTTPKHRGANALVAIPHLPVAYRPTVVLDMARSPQQTWLIPLAGDLTVRLLNVRDGHHGTLFLISDGSARTLTFALPSGVTWLTATPATLAANKSAALGLSFIRHPNGSLAGMLNWQAQP